MKEIILITDGELALKGLNRRSFEDKMVATIRRRLKSLGKVVVERAQSTIYIKPQDDDFDFSEALDRMGRIFGIAAFSRACVCEKRMEDILAKAPEYLSDTLMYDLGISFSFIIRFNCSNNVSVSTPYQLIFKSIVTRKIKNGKELYHTHKSCL